MFGVEGFALRVQGLGEQERILEWNNGVCLLRVLARPREV